ncbi:polyamine aminopropyltransferase [Bacillus carboniphilus]|uniref:Polyamine aminopropyltransferase n=1 Tax=Bacillus carboniphilus TaxID=86663 RepID=A0ABY9JSE7_9BACI|nr:polyamine aminopropyltransferase [Bacillus carboniphilus]WLR42324.1 polyamine aminopropyltransferase [Bacillus carboniphilus]
MSEVIKSRQKRRIFTSSGIVSICGIVYQVLYGAAGSYLFGNSTFFYSLTIGLFLSGMGIGAMHSEKFHKNLISTFIMTEYLIAMIGGFSIFFLFYMQVNFGDSIAKIFLYTVIIITGYLTGLELPLLIRKSEEINADLKESTAKVLFFDYAGSLIGTITFALLLRPSLGLIRTGFLIAFINIIVAVWLSFSFKDEVKNKATKFIGFILMILIILGFLFGEKYTHHLEKKLYRDPIIYNQETEYQRIVMTKAPQDLRLFLNGQLQFAESDEYRYHESLVHIPMSLSKGHENVLILGGGDGLAIREVLKYEGVKEITLVDLDPKMTQLAKEHHELKRLNQAAFDSEKVNVFNDDAFTFLNESKDLYDVILIDLPDPNNENLNKLYTWEFYSLVRNHLSEDGFTSIQSTSPVFATEAFWTISNTVKYTGLHVDNYHLDIPSFGNWGFTLASRKPFTIDEIELSIETKYLTDEMIPALFHFGKDEDEEIIHNNKKVELPVNSLNRPNLLDYYEKAWKYY